MTAEEMVDELRQELGTFGEPYLNGFPDDDDSREGVKLLPALNKAYNECVWLGMLQCRITLTLNQDDNDRFYREFAIPNTFTEITELRLAEPDGSRIYVLEENNMNRITAEQSGIYNRPPKRPTEFFFGGGFMGFNYTPDQAYVMDILADVEPVPMQQKTDSPRRLATFFHRGLVIGAAFFIGRRALGMEGMNEFKQARWESWGNEWEEWKKRIRQTYNSRALNTNKAPIIDEYRLRDGAILYGTR